MGVRVHYADCGKDLMKLGGIVVQFLRVAAADFAVEKGALRDDVAFQAALQIADVGGSFGVKAAQGQAGQEVAGNNQGGDTLFRFQSSMGGPAGDVGFDDVLGWGGHGKPVGRAFAVKDDAYFGGKAVKIQVMRAEQAALLGPGKDYLDGTVGGPFLPEGGQGFEDDGDAGFAVAAEDGRAVGAQEVAVQLGADAAPRLYGVEVRRQDDRLARSVLPGDNIAKGVGFHPEAQGFEPGGNCPGHFILLPGGAVDAYQVGQSSQQSFPVSHNRSPFCRVVTRYYNTYNTGGRC